MWVGGCGLVSVGGMSVGGWVWVGGCRWACVCVCVCVCVHIV